MGLEGTWSGLEVTKWCTTRSDNHILYKYSSKLVGFRDQRWRSHFVGFKIQITHNHNFVANQ